MVQVLRVYRKGLELYDLSLDEAFFDERKSTQARLDVRARPFEDQHCARATRRIRLSERTFSQKLAQCRQLLTSARRDLGLGVDARTGLAQNEKFHVKGADNCAGLRQDFSCRLWVSTGALEFMPIRPSLSISEMPIPARLAKSRHTASSHSAASRE
jgi:hypothetical protein